MYTAFRWLLTVLCVITALALFLWLAVSYHYSILAAMCPAGSLDTHRMFLASCQDLRVNILYQGSHLGVAALFGSMGALVAAPRQEWRCALGVAWFFCVLALLMLVYRVSWTGLVGLGSSLVAALVLVAMRDTMRYLKFNTGTHREPNERT
jgi:hypothetical protein